MKPIFLLWAFLAMHDVLARDILWLQSHLPPASIEVGEDKFQGYVDRVETVTRSSMPDFTHIKEWVPSARLKLMMKVGGPYCTVGVPRTQEGLHFMRFTSPVGWIHPIGVIFRRNEYYRFAHFLDQEGRIDLTLLVKDSNLRAGAILGRSYGTSGDKALQLARFARRANEVGSFDVVLRMLQGERIDFTLGTVEELKFHATQRSEYVFLPTTEMSSLTPISYSCSRDRRADIAFAAITHALDKNKLATVFQAEYERWLSPEYLPQYRKLLRKESRSIKMANFDRDVTKSNVVKTE